MRTAVLIGIYTAAGNHILHAMGYHLNIIDPLTPDRVFTIEEVKHDLDACGIHYNVLADGSSGHILDLDARKDLFTFLGNGHWWTVPKSDENLIELLQIVDRMGLTIVGDEGEVYNIGSDGEVSYVEHPSSYRLSLFERIWRDYRVSVLVITVFVISGALISKT